DRQCFRASRRALRSALSDARSCGNRRCEPMLPSFPPLATSARSQANDRFGRRARLQGLPREGPESGRKPSFDCGREIGFAVHNGSFCLLSQSTMFVLLVNQITAPSLRSASRRADTFRARGILLPCTHIAASPEQRRNTASLTTGDDI